MQVLKLERELTVDQQLAVFGVNDENIKIIEKALSVSISQRNGNMEVKSESEESAQTGMLLLRTLLEMYDRGETIDAESVFRMLEAAQNGDAGQALQATSDVIAVSASGRPIRCKTIGQKNYIKALNDDTVTICIGPAGTGKTYLAVAQAVSELRSKKISKIIMSRPAIEAGEERLGFLPGDLAQKVDPYLRPLYDALEDLLGGAEAVQKNMEKGIIEIAPLAYMRGRTLTNARVLIDESQNASLSTLKMALTRLGEGSKMVLTGDVTQIDLPKIRDSGLERCASILGGIEGISVVRLNNRDVVRNRIVKEIVKAFERAETDKKPPQAARSPRGRNR